MQNRVYRLMLSVTTEELEIKGAKEPYLYYYMLRTPAIAYLMSRATHLVSQRNDHCIIHTIGM